MSERDLDEYEPFFQNSIYFILYYIFTKDLRLSCVQSEIALLSGFCENHNGDPTLWVCCQFFTMLFRVSSLP